MNVYDFQVFSDSCFAESIVYTPKGAAPKTINAVVFREAPVKTQVAKTDVPVQNYAYRVMVNRTDITAVVVGEDIITMPDNHGVSKSFRVQAVLNSDPGCFKLGVN